MDFPLYHDPYHHYDPTIINVHTLLKPQPYQHPPSINTHISPPPTNPNSIDSNSLHNLIRHINYATEQILHSQRACLHTISKFKSDISSLHTHTHTLTPPNFTYQQPIIPSTTVFNHNFNQHSHDPFPPPKSIPFNHPNFTQEPKSKIEITQEPHGMVIDGNDFSDTIAEYMDEPKEFVVETVVDPEIPNLTICFDFDPVFEVVGKQQVVIAEDFNDVAVSQLTPDFSSIPETDEKLNDDVVLVKGQETEPLKSSSQSPCDSNRVESLTIQSIVNVPIGLVSAKHHSINTPLPSPEKKVVLIGAVAETPQQNPFFIYQLYDFPINPFDPGGTTTAFAANSKDRFLEFLNPCFVIFDPGGDKHQFRSLAANFGNGLYVFDPGGDKCIFGSPMTLISSPAIVSFPVKAAALGAASGRPWVPWYRLHSVNNGGVDVFDPGGNESKFHSPALIGGNDRHTLSMLWLPWDRGKLCMSKSLFSISVKCLVSFTPPTTVSFPMRGAASGWPWVPWKSMKMTSSIIITAAKRNRGKFGVWARIGICLWAYFGTIWASP